MMGIEKSFRITVEVGDKVLLERNHEIREGLIQSSQV